MAVTPEVQALLDLIAAADAPPTHEQEPPAVREAFAALLAMIPKDDIASVEDRTIPGPAGPLPVRVYRSAETENGRGLLVYFHGGGWTIGSVETHDAGCRSLAEGAGRRPTRVSWAPTGHAWRSPAIRRAATWPRSCRSACATAGLPSPSSCCSIRPSTSRCRTRRSSRMPTAT